MQATITYLLTEQAQRAAMAATGTPVARTQKVAVEIKPEDLQLVDVNSTGAATLDLTQQWDTARLLSLQAAGWVKVGAVTAAPSADVDVLADLRRGAAIYEEQQRAKQAAEQETMAANGAHNRAVTEAAYQAFLADPTARVTAHDGPRSLVKDTRSPADWWPEEHAEFLTEIRRRNEADAAEKKRFEAEKEQAKREYIDTWIAEHAAPEIQEQHEAGLLARAEALTMIAERACAAAGMPAEHDVTMCKIQQCSCGIKDVDGISTTVYARWKPIKQGLPEGTEVEFEKSRDCLRDGHGEFEDQDASAPYYTALIKMPVGPFVFERRIKL